MQQEDRYSDEALRNLAKHGIQKAKREGYDAIRFELWNEHEANVIKEWMAANAPEFPYYITRTC